MRVLSVVASAVVLLVALAVWNELAMLGFPDGYVTAYDQATIVPHRIFCLGSVVVAAAMIAIAVVPRRRIALPFALVAGLYVAGAVGTFYGHDEVYLGGQHLDRGAGG